LLKYIIFVAKPLAVIDNAIVVVIQFNRTFSQCCALCLKINIAFRLQKSKMVEPRF